ncbi:group-specific protein [Cohnella fermenti]|uniref:Group-specific protein n=1 Tax=Cohnella fermenti TaxID=2565925 RepID=A0A4S4C8B6_9BACL|nr:group-specific protein [Cohnella fermenti]THF83894.1 group-specific protein [Cohnella fermenti]
MRMCQEKIREMLREADYDLVFWDSRELRRRTSMSWNFIVEQFFYHPDFPKRKIGSKWLFPARETRQFLERWLLEQ